MVKGTNEAGEQSFYIYNGLGYLVGNEWIIKKSSYGYTGVDTTASEQVNGVVVCDRHSHVTGNGHINPTGKGHTTGGTTGGSTPTIDNKKYQVVHKDYVIDYTSTLKDVIMETESGVGGLTYRYVYGLNKVEVVIYGVPNGAGSIMQYVYDDVTGELVLTATDPGQDVVNNSVVKLYYHHDHLGSTDYLTNNVSGRVVSYVTYDDWGNLTAKAILKCGVRELDLVQSYTTYAYDMVLDVYFAQARMYDAADRRFIAMDLIKGAIASPLTLTQYTYVLNNPLVCIDPWGLEAVNPYNALADLVQNGLPGIGYDNGNVNVADLIDALNGYPGIITSVAYNPTTAISIYTIKYNGTTLTLSMQADEGTVYTGYIFSSNGISGTIAVNNIRGQNYISLSVLKNYFGRIWCGTRALTYKTLDQVAVAWAIKYNPESIATNREFASLIKGKDGAYYYEEPQRGSNEEKDQIGFVSDSVTVSVIHSHAAYDDLLDYSWLSKEDYMLYYSSSYNLIGFYYYNINGQGLDANEEFSPTDKSNAYTHLQMEEEFPLFSGYEYLTTPNGDVKKYDTSKYRIPKNDYATYGVTVIGTGAK